MQPYEVLVVGPEGRERTGLEGRLKRLGHEVTAAGPACGPTGSCDVVVVDARTPGVDWDDLVGDLRDELRTLLVVADRPERLAPFTDWRAGVVVLTGAESDNGYQVALRVCAGLRRPADPAVSEA
jgi:hypothetical protein